MWFQKEEGKIMSRNLQMKLHLQGIILFLLQKALDPVCCSVCYPCSGIFERYFFCKCFVATVALISMDKEVPYVCSTSLYWNIFEFDLSVFINIYTASTIRAPNCLRWPHALQKQYAFIFIRADSYMCSFKSLTFKLNFDII